MNLTTLLAVYDKDDKLLQRFEYADGRMPLSFTDNGGDVYYISYNQIGSPRAITDVDGNILKTLTYDSFGTIIHDSHPLMKIPFGFAGGLYDSDTKLTRFGYRDYDASTGKWTAKDPIGFDGGDTNLYGYVLGDPVNGIDPKGLFTPVAGAVAGAVAGGFVGAVGAYASGGSIVKGFIMGAIGGAGAGFFAGMGNIGMATTAWQVTGFGFDAVMNAANVMDALNNEDQDDLENFENIDDADICFRR